VAALLEVRADAKNLRLSVAFEGAFPATIRTDATRLRQILINLVGNAIKFTESGSVTITARLAADDAANAKLQFDVADTGIGMTAAQIARLFEPFMQVDASCSRTYGGTGLGLAISRRLARMLDGDISVTSMPGAGSVFRLEIAAGPVAAINAVDRASFLPRSPDPETSERTFATDAAAAAEPEAAPRSDRQLEGMRILLAEDGPDNRLLVGHVLRAAGADVAFAENGRAAVDCAREAVRDGAPFDVILMDMQMPVLDGYAATRELRAGGFDGPIVALTAHAMADDRQKCLDAGCDDYASKPINRPELLAILARHARPMPV
jgi:CheY-like chemotaxis protein